MLKQLGCMWYNNLIEYFLKEWFRNDLFVLEKILFFIIVVYVNDIDVVRTPKGPPKAIDRLKKKFQMNDLGRTKFCLGLQIEYLNNRVFVHQKAYITKVLKMFYHIHYALQWL